MELGDLTPETTYFFTVSAENSFGEGEQSEVADGETAEAPKIPSNPTGLSQIGKTTSSISISFFAAPAVPGNPITMYNVNYAKKQDYDANEQFTGVR